MSDLIPDEAKYFFAIMAIFFISVIFACGYFFAKLF